MVKLYAIQKKETRKMDTRKNRANQKSAVDEFHTLFYDIAQLSVDEKIISLQNIWWELLKKPVLFFWTPILVGLDIEYADGWSLWRPFSFNLPYFDLFCIFDLEWP